MVGLPPGFLLWVRVCRPRAFVFLWERERTSMWNVYLGKLCGVPLFYVFKVVGKRYLHGGGLLLFFLVSWMSMFLFLVWVLSSFCCVVHLVWCRDIESLCSRQTYSSWLCTRVCVVRGAQSSWNFHYVYLSKTWMLVFLYCSFDVEERFWTFLSRDPNWANDFFSWHQEWEIKIDVKWKTVIGIMNVIL